jgi:F0F1-type ATP synthase membrane subunit c/vacuolar-type H+-ATPase subunit K
LLAGGFAFVADRWWGVPGAGIRASLAATGGGLLCLMAAFYLANGSGLSLGEYFQLVTKVPRNQRLQYYLPVLGAGLVFYGLLGYGRAWFLQRGRG